MYKPLLNTVLVEIVVDKWAPGKDDSMLGPSYREGKVVEFGPCVDTHDNPLPHEGTVNGVPKSLDSLKGRDVMWNEGVEAGTTFEEDGKLYGFIYWWDIRGVKSDA